MQIAQDKVTESPIIGEISGYIIHTWSWNYFLMLQTTRISPLSVAGLKVFYCIYKVSVRKPEGKRPLLIHRHKWLKWALRKYNRRVRTAFIWLSISISGKLLCTQQ
jgi:hypothetical protein